MKEFPNGIGYAWKDPWTRKFTWLGHSAATALAQANRLMAQSRVVIKPADIIQVNLVEVGEHKEA